MNEMDTMKSLRKRMLAVSNIGRDGNLQSGFSSLEILWALYHGGMNYTQENRMDVGHDRFVLSKGQSNLALMTVLAECGYIGSAELETFCGIDSRISMQADRTKFDGLIECSAGSLGHGFPIAVGMALAAKLRRSGEHVYVLVGDGEMNEGTMWEAMLFAASENLDNITMIVDDNGSVNKMLRGMDLPGKFSSFGFAVETVNGHNIGEIRDTLQKRDGRPRAVLAKTVRGYGCKTLMEDDSWFHRYPRADELAGLYKEVDEF